MTVDLEDTVRRCYEAIQESAAADPAGPPLHDDHVLHVPAWGIEISGGAASLAWLRADVSREGRPHVDHVVARGDCAVVFLHREPSAGDGSEACHVLHLDGDRVRSWCVVPDAPA